MAPLTLDDSRAIQLALVQSIDLPPTLPAASTSLAIEFASAILSADFSSVLLSPASKSIFSSPEKVGIDDLWTAAELSAASTPEQQSATPDDELLVKLCIAVALLQSFVQLNWTGPSLSFTPSDLFPSITDEVKSSTNAALHAATIPLLALDGEPAYHLCSSPTFLLLSLRLLKQVADEGKLETASWWLLRAEMVHQTILDEPVPLDPKVLKSVADLASPSSAPSSLPLDADALATLHATLGLAHHSQQEDRASQAEFLAAGKATGLEWQLTGAMGKRTKFQVTAMSQLVLVARSRLRDGETEEEGEDVEVIKEEAPEREAVEGEETETKPRGMPETLALNDDTLLEQTEYTSSSIADSGGILPPRLSNLDPAAQPALHPLDQSLLICMCLAQHNTTPEHGLTTSQMAPYLTRVISHPRNWSVHTTALLLRARLEAKRSRTVERSALQLQALVDQMPTADSKASERLKYFYSLPLPSKWDMEKELAQRFLSLGVVRSALEIFQRLEMWEEAVRCYVSMERSDQAVEVVKELLEGKKEEVDIKTNRLKLAGKEMAEEGKVKRRAQMDNSRQAKLWCLLADLQPESAEEYYHKAWEISGHTSSRSQRSLGAMYLAKEQFAAAIPYFERALKINPLYARTWFALGCCLVREERWGEAREAFSRNVSIDDDDGEAWNNLAAVYLRLDEDVTEKAKRAAAKQKISGLDEDKESELKQDDDEDEEAVKAVPFENKRLAFRALQQGLRFSRDNWRMWTNFMIVAVDVGELSEAARALGQIMEHRARTDTSDDVDVAVLSKLVDAVTREDWNGGKGSRSEDKAMTSNEGLGLLPIVERLFNTAILPKVSDSPQIFVIQARLMRWKEDWSAALECYLRAWRCGPASQDKVETDRALFKDAVIDLSELVDLMRNLGPRAHDQEVAAGLVKGKAKWTDWRFSARTLVRTFMGRTKSSFEDEPEFDQLKEIIEDLRN